MPLLKKQLKVAGYELGKPPVTIVKDAEGKYNFESTEKTSTKEQPGAAFSLNDLKLSKGMLVYLDKKTGEKTELRISIWRQGPLFDSRELHKERLVHKNFDCRRRCCNRTSESTISSPL